MNPAKNKHALEVLLRSMFSDAELRMFIHRLPDADRLVESLPGVTASLLQVVFDAIELLDRHGVIDRDFFEKLAELRPRKRNAIAEVASAWGVTMGASTLKTNVRASPGLASAAASSTPRVQGPRVSPDAAPAHAGMTSSPAGSDSWEEYVPPQASDGTFPVSRLANMWGTVMQTASARGLRLTARPYKGNDHSYSSGTEGLRQVQVRALRTPSTSPVVQDSLNGPSVEVSFAGSGIPLLGSSSGTEGRLPYVAGTTRESGRHKGDNRLRVVVLLEGWESLADDEDRGSLLAEAFRAAIAVFERLSGFSLAE